MGTVAGARPPPAGPQIETTHDSVAMASPLRQTVAPSTPSDELESMVDDALAAVDAPAPSAAAAWQAALAKVVPCVVVLK